MKKIILIFSAIVFALSINAQDFEGRIVFNMDYPKLPDPSMASMLPKETSTYYKDGKSRFELNMAMGVKNATVTDSKTGSAIVLMDMMGQKYALTGAGEDEESKKMAAQIKVTPTKDSKKIAGYNCNKVIVEVPASKSAEASKMEAWATKDLKFPKGYSNGAMKNVEGMILQYSIVQNGLEMVLTAKEVIKEKVSDELFKVPADYKVMTQEEFMKAMGQGK